MRVARSSEKDARAFIFEFRGREDALAHRLLTQACVERVSILPLDERSETLRQRGHGRFPVSERIGALKKQIAKFLAERVELAERLRRVRFVNYAGAKRVLVIFEDEKENVVLKAEEVATDKRLADGRLG
jgi:hypothetical protein